MKTTGKAIAFIITTFLLFIAGCYIPPEDDPVEPVDEIPPVVTIAFPPGGSVVSGEALIRALATDNRGIQKVVLYVDGLPLPVEAYSEPYEMIWDTWKFKDSTEHIVTVRAYDYSYNMADSDPMTYLIDQSSFYPLPVKLFDVVFADSAYTVTWTKSKESDFASYTVLESMNADLSDEKVVYSTWDADDTVYIATNIPFEDVRFYRVKLTNLDGYEVFSPVMKAESPGPPVIPPEGMMAYFPFNGNAQDESGNGHDGIVYDAVLTADRHGNPDQAYDFEANSGTIIVTDPGSFNYLESFTLAAWVYRKSNFTGPCQGIITKVSPQRDFVLQLSQTGLPDVHFAYDPGIYYTCYGPDFCPVAKWVHLAGVWTGDTWKLYVNGELVATSPHPGHQPPWTSEEMFIGSMGGNEIFQGLIDEVLIYNRELTGPEIAGLAIL
jgi:hypothetical protein